MGKKDSKKQKAAAAVEETPAIDPAIVALKARKDELDVIDAEVKDKAKSVRILRKVAEEGPSMKAKLIERLAMLELGFDMTPAEIEDRITKRLERSDELDEELVELKIHQKDADEIAEMQAKIDAARIEQGLVKGANTVTPPRAVFIRALDARGWIKKLDGRKITELVFTEEGKEVYRIALQKEGWVLHGAGIPDPRPRVFDDGIKNLDEALIAAKTLLADEAVATGTTGKK